MKSNIIGILVAVFLLLGIGQIMEMSKPKCVMPGCDDERTSGSRYCFLHDLSYKSYGNPDYHAVYQQSKARQKQAAGTYSSNRTGDSSMYSGSSGTGNAYSSNSGVSSTRYNSSSTSSEYSRSRSSVSSKSGSSSRSRSVDPYDADDFDNADDFADEWAEEFGDGDFEEGYEDAYDYWEEYTGQE